jgi:hypothetical protein
MVVGAGLAPALNEGDRRAPVHTERRFVCRGAWHAPPRKGYFRKSGPTPNDAWILGNCL